MRQSRRTLSSSRSALLESLEGRLFLHGMGGHDLPPLRMLAPLTVADFTGDGKADLLIRQRGGLSILPGNGDGTFAAARSVSGVPQGRLLVGDFTGDGRQDLLVATRSTITTEGESEHAAPVWQLLSGNGDGTFAAPVNATGVPDGPVFVGDFSGDGKADLLSGLRPATRGALPAVQLVLSNGDGMFAAATHQATNVAFRQISGVGDFNHDGKADLLIRAARTTTGGGGLSAMLSAGDGTFSTGPTISSTATGPVVAVADFNDDGQADVMTAALRPQTRGRTARRVPAAPAFDVYLSQSDGTYGAAVNTTNVSSVPLAAADLNGDGKADLLVRGSWWQGLRTQLGNGDGTFADPIAAV